MYNDDYIESASGKLSEAIRDRFNRIEKNKMAIAFMEAQNREYEAVINILNSALTETTRIEKGEED